MSTAVCNDGLFTALATHSIILLSREVTSHKALGLNFDNGALVVVVCAAIRRVVGPCLLVVGSLLSDQSVLALFDLEALSQRRCANPTP